MAFGGPSAPVAGLSLAAVLRAGIIGSRPSLPRHHWRILNALLACRTPALGGHCYRCLECGRTHFVPHSCRNRHCPLCQGRAAKGWLAKQEAALLPVPYFHLVFTLPHALTPLIQQNQRALYNLLFHAASQTLLEFGQNRFQAQLGIPAVLHTWSQTLLDHYHLHCIVTGGGLSTDSSQWVSAPPHFLFAVRALSLVFRGKYCAGLEQLYAEGQLQFHGKLQPLGHPKAFKRLLRQAVRHKWTVFAKRPFAGPGFPGHARTDIVSIGTVVQAMDLGANQPETFTILGAWDSDPDKGVISYLSPVAQSLLNNKVGDEVEFELHGAKRRHRIERIEAFRAAAAAPNGTAAVVSTP